MSVDRDADSDKWGVRFNARALHLLPSELVASSQLLRDLRQAAHPFLPFEDLVFFLPGRQGKRFYDSLVFIRTMNEPGGGTSLVHSQSQGPQYGAVLAVLVLSLALATQLQESLGSRAGESGQQDEMAAALKDIENLREMTLVIEAAGREQSADARKKIMQSIRSGAFGNGLVAIPAVVVWLDAPDTDASVRCEACATMGWFGPEVLDHVPNLMAVALKVKGESKGKGKFKGKVEGEGEGEEKVEEKVEEKAVRVAAVRALARIDPSGESIIGKIRDIRHLDKIIPLLAPPGEAEGTLRKVLKEKKSKIQMGPAEGYFRWQLKDIVTYLFGQCPYESLEESRKWKNSREGNIHDWMDAGTLPGMRIDTGLYDVRAADLETLRKRQSSSPEAAEKVSDSGDSEPERNQV